jgi:signal recognition particle subunit SRP54
MIPGASKAMKDVEIEDDAFKHIDYYSFYDSFRASKPSLIDVKRKAKFQRFRNKLSKSIN